MTTTTKTKPRLFQYEACPFCWKVRALLEYKGIPYETVEVHPINKKELDFTDYKKVPVLIDANHKEIDDSDVIMRHLDHQYVDYPVFEKDQDAKLEEEKWIQWGNGTLVKGLPPLIYGSIRESLRSFAYITAVSKFSWLQQRVIKYIGALIMTLVAKKTAKAQGITNPKKHFSSCIASWSAVIEGRQFLGGDKPNGADLTVYGVLRSIESLSAFDVVRSHPECLSWYDRVKNQLS